MQIIDSQLHIFGPETESRAADFGQRPMQAADVVAEMDAAGVARAVVVATSTPTTEIALDAARLYPDRFGVMGSLRLDRPENRELLGSWRERPGMLGIRLSFPPWRQPSWLEDGSADWFWPAAALAGLPVMVWPPDQLDQFARIAERNPELKIIVDHFGLYVDVMDDAVHEQDGSVARGGQTAKCLEVPVRSLESQFVGRTAEKVRRERRTEGILCCGRTGYIKSVGGCAFALRDSRLSVGGRNAAEREGDGCGDFEITHGQYFLWII